VTRSSRAERAHSQPRRGLRREEAAIYLGLSPSMFDEMVKAGELPTPRKFRTASVWDMRLLDSQFDAPQEVANENEWNSV
jgi:predicted DNA-binding transcriptional regulator AlpA